MKAKKLFPKKGEINSPITKPGLNGTTIVKIKKDNDYKKNITMLKQRYSVKGVKTFRGHEGIGFNASLYLGKKKIAFVIDEASGGDFYFEQENLEALKELKLACKNIGMVPSTYYIGSSHQYHLDSFISELIDDYEAKKKSKKEGSK